MLRFTEAQQAVILANRREFNRRQEEMAQLHGNSLLVGNATPVPRDVWGVWDREAVSIQREVLAVFNDLAASVAMPIPIAKLVHYFQTVSDSGEVNVSLDGRSKARSDQQNYDYHGTPLPIIDSRFGYGWRQVEAARSEGFQLDGAGRLNAMHNIAEKMELLALDGDSSIVVGGNTLYGLRTHPNRNTRATTNTLVSATGAQWKADMDATLALLHADNFRVPATVYVNWADWRHAQITDYTASYSKTIAARLMEDSAIREVIPATNVAANEIIAVVKDRRVVQVLNGMPMVTRAQFRANPEDDYDFVTMAATAIEVKYDATGACGIAHSS